MNNIKYTIQYLKDELTKHNLSTKGKKQELYNRLMNYHQELRKGWDTDIVYVSDKIEYSEKDEIYLGTRYNKIKGNGLLRFEKNQGNFDMYLDRNMLKMYIIEDKKVPDQVIEAIINIYTSKIKKTKAITNFPTSNIPVGFDKVFRQNDWIKTKLYKHQLQSVYWMKKLEHRIKSNTLNYKYKTNNSRFQIFDKFDPSLIFDVKEKSIVIGNKETTTYHEMKTYGGILADDVGLGKTLSILSLFIEHNDKHKILNKINPIEHSFYPNANCNLVICPGYLVDQWSNEIFKHIYPPLKHYVITGKKQHEELNYKDILTSDVVIVSDKFLRSNYYTSLKGSFSELQLNNENPLLSYNPIFHYIEWSRIVIDEGHLILSNSLNVECIDKISSKYRWYVSATPVTQSSLILEIAKFLRWNVLDENYQPYIKPFFMARTKEDLKDDVIIPDYEEEIDLIPMTCFERQVYENCSKTYNKTLLRQLCCSVLICSEFKDQCHKTLKEFQQYLVCENQEKIKQIEKSLRKQRKDKEYYEKLLEREKDEMPIEMQSQTMKNIIDIEKNIETEEEKKISINRYINYQESMIENMEKSEHTCIICYEKLKDNIMITSCCHVYCEKCISQIDKCSVCRKEFTITRLGLSQDMNTKLVNHYGSKIAKLINHLSKLHTQNPNFKAVIFSQWNRMLSIVGESLEKTKISYVICNNNMKQIKNTLDKFQNESNVMLLSMQSHYSGLDLHNATHIFFLDVLSGTEDEIEKKEKQAIGRVYRIGQKNKIKIVRLIMKDTIEFDLWKK